MAIRPPSDIVLDVARAADPMRYEAAKTKLQSLAGPAGASGFDDVFGEIVRKPRRTLPQATLGGMTALRNAAALSRPASCSAGGGEDPRTSAAYRSFEAMTLKTVVEAMLPSDSDAVYGKGLSGDVWRSMLAEQVAVQISESGGVGIAERLADADTRRQERTMPRSVAALADALAPGAVSGVVAAEPSHTPHPPGRSASSADAGTFPRGFDDERTHHG
jgi:Rod binding domain-containing protein